MRNPCAIRYMYLLIQILYFSKLSSCILFIPYYVIPFIIGIWLQSTTGIPLIANIFIILDEA